MHTRACTCIYIYIEREREADIYIYILVPVGFRVFSSVLLDGYPLSLAEDVKYESSQVYIYIYIHEYDFGSIHLEIYSCVLYVMFWVVKMAVLCFRRGWQAPSGFLGKPTLTQKLDSVLCNCYSCHAKSENG